MNFLWSLLSKFRYWQYERLCMKHLGIKPTKIYLSQMDYDSLVERLNEPPDPKVMERFREILNKKSPWNEDKQ